MCIRYESSAENPEALPIYSGVIREGKIELDHPVTFPDGVRVRVQLDGRHNGLECRSHGIVAGFGPAGRWVADLLDRYSMPYCIIERNPKTVATQESLGKRVVLGDVCEEATLEAAGVREAGILAVTIPDEKAAVRAIRCAKSLNPSLVIFAKTEYTSTALLARKAGADVVISAEVAVAKEFHELLLLCLTSGLPEAAEGR